MDHCEFRYGDGLESWNTTVTLGDIEANDFRVFTSGTCQFGVKMRISKMDT